MTTPTRSLSPEEAEARRQREQIMQRLRAVGGQAHRGMIEELVALDPDHAQEHWDRWNNVGFGKDEVRALMAELRKPKLPKTEGVAELANRQSTEQLFARHEEEVRKAKEAWDRAARHNERVLGGRLSVGGDRYMSGNAAARATLDATNDPAEVARLRAGWERDRFQGMVDHWGNAQRFAAEAERKLREDLDPYNLGLYGVHGTLYGRDDR